MAETWGHKETNLQIFVASPDDVRTERNFVSKVVEEINHSIGQKIGILIKVRMWENFRPRGENVMKFIEHQLKDCDLLVMIFHRRFGSSPSEGSEYRSGTEAEYEIASQLREDSKNSRPEIFSYFRDITDKYTLDDPGPELKKLLEFQKRIKNTVFYKKYSSPEIFPLVFKEHLVQWILEISEKIDRDEISNHKQRIWQDFFAFGASKSKHPSVQIVYPPAKTNNADITHLSPYLCL